MAKSKSNSVKKTGKTSKIAKEKAPKKKVEFDDQNFLKELLSKCQDGEDGWVVQKEVFGTGALKKLQIPVFKKACSEGLINN